MKKKILITHVHMETGGIETALVNLLSSLDKNKYEIDLLLYYPKGNLLSLIPSWVNVIPVWQGKFLSSALEKLTMSRNILFRIIKNFVYNDITQKYFTPNKTYDFAIAFSGYFNFTDMIVAKSKSTKKLIWVHADFYTQYQIDNNFKKKFNKIYKKYKYFDKVVCVSKTASENLKLLCPEFSNKIAYLWNINNKREIKSSNEKLMLNSSYNIITIARLFKYKGLEKLIDIAKKMCDNNIDGKIYIAGDGPLRESLQNKIDLLNLQNNIELLGNVNNIFEILEQADLYLSPSDCEGYGNVLLESLISGVPIVSTPTAGSIDIFESIAPENSIILSSDLTADSLYTSILEAKSGKVSKDFMFDETKLNKRIICGFENLLS